MLTIKNIIKNVKHNSGNNNEYSGNTPAAESDIKSDVKLTDKHGIEYNNSRNLNKPDVKLGLTDNNNISNTVLKSHEQKEIESDDNSDSDEPVEQNSDNDDKSDDDGNSRTINGSGLCGDLCSDRDNDDIESAIKKRTVKSDIEYNQICVEKTHIKWLVSGSKIEFLAKYGEQSSDSTTTFLNILEIER